MLFIKWLRVLTMSDRTKHQQLGAQDAQFVYSQTPSNLTHVMSVSVYEPPGGRRPYDFFGRVVNVVKDRLHASPAFHRKLIRAPLDIDHPCWVEDEHFDPEAHITRVADASIPTRVLSPYGNSVLMMSMLKDERVAAESSTLVEGRGVYAIASKDEDGVAVMLWNYQSTDNTELSIHLDLQNLPAAVTGKSVHQRRYRIDAETSNYWANPKKADLQLVEEAAVITGSGYSMTVNFAANALHLIILEPSE